MLNLSPLLSSERGATSSTGGSNPLCSLITHSQGGVCAVVVVERINCEPDG